MASAADREAPTDTDLAMAGAVSGLSISDVLDVIETDLDRMNPAVCSAPPAAGYPASVASVPPLHLMEPAATDDSGLSARVVIMEQPAGKALRFRYECEGRSAGSLPGTRSTAERKTHPAIAVLGYRGPAVVVVSCVTKDHPYRPHPHNLVGKDGCKKGVCTLNINVDTMSQVFSNLGIQCVKKKDVDDSLKLRESIRVDPFQTGFEHRQHQPGIDLNAVRLCFQVFLEGDKPGQFCVPLKPIVSEPIYDKKSMCELAIYKMSDCCASVAGGRDIILLCDKVAKDDIEIRFFEVQDQQLIWEGFGEFQPADVHRQVAIAFKTPRYVNLEVESPVRVQIQLRRLSDRQSSEPRPFHFTPIDTDGVDEKKRKMSRNSERVQQYLPDNGDGYSTNNMAACSVRPRTRSPGRARHRSVKREPTDIGSPDHLPAVSVLSPQSVIAGGLSPGVLSPGGLSPGGLSHGGLSPGGLSPGHVALGDCRSPGRSPATTLGVASPASPAHPECMAVQYPTALSPHQYIKPEPARRGYAVSPAPATPAAPTSPKLSNVPLELPQELDLGVSHQQQDHIELDMGRLTSEDFRMLSFPSDLNLQAINDHLSHNLSQHLSILDEPPPDAEVAQPLAASAAAAGDVRMDSGQLDSLTRNTISQLKELNALSRK